MRRLRLIRFLVRLGVVVVVARVAIATPIPHRQRLPTVAVKMAAHQFRYVIVHRTGMRLLLGNAELWQHLNHLMRGDLQLPGQLVYPDFTHSKDCDFLVLPSLLCVLRVLYRIKFTFAHGRTRMRCRTQLRRGDR